MKYEHVMTDIESLGLNAGDMILSYAFVPFEIGGDYVKAIQGKECSGLISVDDSSDNGFKIDVDTLKWWLSQKEGRLLKLMLGTDYITQVLGKINGWFKLECSDNVKVWASALDMDIPMMSAYYKVEHIEIPWKFYNQRCVRTFCDGYYEELKPIREKWKGERHTALGDCLMQISEMDFVKSDRR